MAYGKRRYKRKPYRKRGYKAAQTRQTVKDKTITVWSDHSVLEKANKALQLASKVYRFVNTEIKKHELDSSTSLTTAGQVVTLNGIVQGDTDSTRTGSSIKPMHLTMNMTLDGNGSGANTQSCRLIVFRVKDDKQATPAVTDYLTTADLRSHKNWNNRFDYETLHDQIYQVNENVSGPDKRFFKLHFKLTKHIQYTTGANTVEGGGLYFLCITDQATFAPALQWNTRMTYVDN